MGKLSKNAQEVQDLLVSKGYENEVVELPGSCHTAKEAAKALGCKVEQIAKSIVFRLKESDNALMVIASGPNRINERHVGNIIGEKLLKADAEFVKDRTGYSIGGVSPVVQKSGIKILIDEDLLQYSEIWGAAGHPKAVFKMDFDELLELTDGEVMDIKGQ
ncbi:MAG: YbaK/EbsC family protein [Tissierellia bacterium]|nr:YbaK/EbsC family protein [Tissierellia bacterium]